MASLVEKDRSVGALIAVDGYQAAGTQPVDVVALGVDIYLGGSVKYLSGGPGNGWMYAAPHVSELLEPVTAGWFGQLEPFAFDPENAYAPGIRRFAGGTLGVLAAYAAEPAYQALADIGLQRVRERSLSMSNSRCWKQHWSGASPSGRPTTRGAVVDHRPGVGIRVSPHFYNTLDEALGVLDAISEILAGR